MVIKRFFGDTPILGRRPPPSALPLQVEADLLLYNICMDREIQTSPNDQQQLPHIQETGTLLHGNRDLAVLYAIASQLNRKVDVREVLQEVLAQVTQLFGLQT